MTALNAITWLFGVETNMTPLLTTGAASCTFGSPVGAIQTSAIGDVVVHNVGERTESPAVVGPADHQPVLVL